VAAGEDGGITQHIGAYSVSLGDNSITFLDTPGHEAFTAMRSRGANLTDICVIVVAADDGIMPQTREAIQHARAAEVTIMVAINKIDLPSANVDRVKQQLQAEGLAPEDWGGELVCCPVSAETGEGLDNLLEMITLQAEMLELKANPGRKAEGYVVEAQLEPGMGPTATVLVRRGTLKVGDTVSCGAAWGRIKALVNDQGVKVRTAGPSSAVKCLGLTEVPEAGAKITYSPNEREARQKSEAIQAAHRAQSLTAPKRASLDDILSGIATEEKVELALIVKADVQGSLEAIIDSLNAIESEKVAIKFILTGVGNITANDVLLASASNAVIIGFHVSNEPGAGATAKREGIEIRLYSVIYELLDDVREAMTGLLAPELREKVLGQAEVRQIFDISKSGRVAGCMVVQGQITAKAKTRVRRSDEVLHEGGRVASLKRFQNDAASVRDGQECGIRLERFSDFEEGDIIEFYEVEEVAQQL
jgi:translation initiation factor IF-2